MASKTGTPLRTSSNARRAAAIFSGVNRRDRIQLFFLCARNSGVLVRTFSFLEYMACYGASQCRFRSVLNDRSWPGEVLDLPTATQREVPST